MIRLAANTGARLHLVEPLAFDLSDKQLRRAGLDYHEYAELRVHADLDDAAGERKSSVRPTVLPDDAALCERTTDVAFQAGDWFVFRQRTRGLAEAVRERFAPERRLRLPMRAGNRSLNLSNAVAVVVYEAWRQLGFPAGH